MAIKILHLSDIHWKNTPEGLDDYKEIREAFLTDIKDYCDSNGKIDYVLICGDIAFSGNKKEYNRAKDFIDDVCKITDCSQENVLLVPGNHDKNRKANHVSMREIIHAGLSSHSKRDGLFNNYLNESPELIHILFEPFRDYCEFSNKYGSSEPIMLRNLQTSPDVYKYDEKKDKLYWEAEIGEINGYKIIVYGFNSALNCDEHDWDIYKSEKDSHKMILPRIAYNIPKGEKNAVRIFMAHHPVEFLANGDDIKINLCKIFRIQFFGHVHHYSPKIENNSLIIHSGAFQPDGKITEEYCPIYNIVDIDIEPINDTKSILKISTDVQKWNLEDSFINLESKSYNIDLHHHKNRFNNPDSSKDSFLNNASMNSKRKVRIALANTSNINEVVRHFTSEVSTMNKIRFDVEYDFLDWVEKNNKWIELAKYLESK